MSNNHKMNKLSLPELLIRVYEKSYSTLDFSEIQNQKAALQWAMRMLEQVNENTRRGTNAE